ncbi:tRNA (N6-isopentenyl adenosine(37)-C2)-methylthiotransferase MiaB [Halanaerobiaceae bacterium Z-7014]|uniref:tRNA-2-methylthio-N(6)-dimethylallyladenosine synthase n=2 Tax=Halonatronomonas betaini TaxID=2778430 RepID=A0A931ARQ1_9FIRM|nr:tRNA (N6-isopentenyl adenosine(37)-C2)-methylthiotransferase MiaB [Halonatronomonas betaini]
MNYHIITYGCQMNEHDSEKIAGMLESMGYQETDDHAGADIIVFNTCLIRKNAELKVFGKVGSLKQLKEDNPEMIIAVGGCMMQQKGPVDELYQKYPQVDIIFGTHNIHKLPSLINQVKHGEERVIDVWEEDKGLIPDLPSKRRNKFQAWVTIIQGCDNYCSYCIVPHVRGSERSRPLEDIVDEVKKLVADGVIDITLLGQNVNSYGLDLDDDYDFPDLLSELAKINGLEKIKYMTSHPKDLSDKLIKTVARNDNISKHFHLPVQSGSSRILKAMNRKYDREHYLGLINKIRDNIPDAVITTDFIVGFPGETESDFEKTLSLVEKVRFDMAYTFAYSPREGTPAAKKADQISSEEKHRRLQALMDKQNQISYEVNQELIGKEIDVLVEGESKKDPDYFSARSDGNKLVIIPAKTKKLIGNIITAKINEAGSWTLYGDIVNN